MSAAADFSWRASRQSEKVCCSIPPLARCCVLALLCFHFLRPSNVDDLGVSKNHIRYSHIHGRGKLIGTNRSYEPLADRVTHVEPVWNCGYTAADCLSLILSAYLGIIGLALLQESGELPVASLSSGSEPVGPLPVLGRRLGSFIHVLGRAWGF